MYKRMNLNTPDTRLVTWQVGAVKINDTLYFMLLNICNPILLY